MVVIVEPKGNYPKLSFGSLATKMWAEFFKAAKPADLAHWMIDPNAGTISLTARQMDVDEDDPAWEPPEPIVAVVRGICGKLNAATDKEECQSLCQDFIQRASEGIKTSFNSDRIRAKYEKFNPQDKSFSIVACPHEEEGLGHDELTVLWKNRKSFSIGKVKSRQAKAAKATSRRNRGVKRTVKKKRTLRRAHSAKKK